MENIVLAIMAANAVSFFGGFSKGLTGFGAPLVMVPLFSLWLPLTMAVPITILLSLVATVPMLRVVRQRIMPRRDLFVAACFALGASFGVHLLVTLPESALRAALGTVLVIFVSYMFLRTPVTTVSPAWTRREGAVLGSAAAVQGVLSGALGGGALPMVPYLAIRYERSDSRAIFVVVFTIGTVVQTAGYAYSGLIDAALLAIVGGAVPGMLFGLVLGAWMHPRVDARLFGRMIAVLLLFPALNMIGIL
ncbi:sulfite exporter TauE/SafE family protein [Fodinicurvata sp. EGI_FJ10296]|uniref:sulfite exporter TauE/SafE family protein n=1 Tax=Fodinicurvata sp. EGI_FJ10296 TaxID=3231908 RepID=UPI0034546CAB